MCVPYLPSFLIHFEINFYNFVTTCYKKILMHVLNIDIQDIEDTLHA